ncbi:MAG: DUF5519 family protein [Candidatus Promineifilaceae bacterium]|nr:DUF5519 family protein [Candidatus Promineifilaceae bacterium]
MAIVGAQKEITAAATSWEGVEARPHRFGGVEYTIGRREIGHIHGDYQVDIPFPVRVREELVAAGDAELHHVLPESGWITVRIRQRGDVAHAIGLLEKSYRLARRQRRR